MNFSVCHTLQDVAHRKVPNYLNLRACLRFIQADHQVHQALVVRQQKFKHALMLEITKVGSAILPGVPACLGSFSPIAFPE
jgi:hypothetical protein